MWVVTQLCDDHKNIQHCIDYIVLIIIIDFKVSGFLSQSTKTFSLSMDNQSPYLPDIE